MSLYKKRANSFHSQGYPVRISELTTDAVIIDQDTFHRAKKDSFYMTAQERMAKALEEEEARKAMTPKIEATRAGIYSAIERRKEAEKLAEEREKQLQHEIALEIAEAKADEELDEVKLFNQDMLGARVRTIRDKQIQYKQDLAEKEKQEASLFAQTFEARRKAAVKLYQEREKNLREAQRKGRRFIEAQIQEKREQAKKEKDIRNLEIAEMKKAAEMMKEEDRCLNTQRRKRQDEFLRECIESNKLCYARKQKEADKEREDVERVRLYQLEKARKEEAYERKVQREKRMKAMELAKVRQMQQKAIDVQAEKDELLARRIQEAAERKQRAKELEEVKKAERIKAEMRENVELAKKMREKRLIEMARLEKQDFDRVMQYQNEQKAKFDEEQRQKAERNEAFRKELLSDIESKRFQKSLEPLVHLDEQKHLQEEREDYLDRLERIRQRKIEQLQSENVPEKYIDDLRSRKIVIK